jgi:hypothetical protein
MILCEDSEETICISLCPSNRKKEYNCYTYRYETGQLNKDRFQNGQFCPEHYEENILNDDCVRMTRVVNITYKIEGKLK